MKFTPFSKFCWFVLAYTVAVILWGAFVRATGSGAGCGSHWPTCNGVVIPRAPEIETIIEFTHRLTSGVLGILTLALLLGAWRRFQKGSPVRRGAAIVLLLVIAEALVGAGIVKFEWVAHNASMARVVTMAFHLANTFFLLAALALTSWWASGGSTFGLRNRGRTGQLLAATLAGTIIVGSGGAVTALGDTLVQNAGIRAEDSPVVAALLDGRIYHPLSALLLGVLLALALREAIQFSESQQTRKLAKWTAVLFGIQLAGGLINVLLKAPVWMQLVHLLVADAFWIALILATASALAREPIQQPVRAAVNLGSVGP